MRPFWPQLLVLGALALGVTPPAHAQVAATHGQANGFVVLGSSVEWTEMIPGVRFGAVYGRWAEEAHGKMVSFDPGVAAPMHVHTGAYYGVVIRGTVTNPYEGDDEVIEMGPGATWYVPGGAPHITACVSAEPCLFYTYSDEGWDLEVVEEGWDGR